MQYGKFYGIGLGPGDPELVTLKAANVLSRVRKIFTVSSRQSERSISQHIVSSLPGINADVIPLEFVMSKDFAERNERIKAHARFIASFLHEGLDCAFVTIGDAMTYSTCSYLLAALKEIDPDFASEIIPGVNSWSALAAAAQKPLVEDREIFKVIPSYIAPDAVELEKTLADGGTTVFLKSYRSRDGILDLLKGREDVEVTYGADLSLESQFISSDAGEVMARPQEYLSLLLVKKRRS